MILRFFAKGFWWQAHPFSLSCMPNGFQLRVSIKKLGDFTSKISTLKPGTRVLIDGPYGVFTPQNYKAKFLFLAGGIGITPIRSILESIPAHNNVILLYSNKSSNAIVFKKELDELAQKNKFSFHYIISDEPEYQGERGRIDKEKLQRLVKDVNQREIYLCGPAPMMEALVSLLSECGVQPAQIHYEKFAL